MNINEIQTFYEQKDIKGLLDELQKTFDAVDSKMDMFKSGITDGTTCQSIISEITGHFMYLNMVLSLAESELRYQESVFYSKRKIDIEREKKEKFVAAAVEKETNQHVSNYRRIRNIVEAYAENCKMAITACQSILKSIADEPKG